MTNQDFLCRDPAVYVVGNRYEIIFQTEEAGAGWVVIDGVRYTDNYAGVVRSSSKNHKVYVKQDVLNRAGSYTVVLAMIPERPPYFPKTTEIFERKYTFRPIPDGEIRAYMLADTHSHIDVPVATAGFFGEGNLDLLILGGDNGNTIDDEDRALTMATLAATVTHGELPVIFMRGNHDNRGAFAEHLADYVGTDGGKPYFSFRLGRLWGVVLDGGEDKPDDVINYGDIADYRVFREEQLEFLRDVNERKIPKDAVRLVLCHAPFASFSSHFDEIFSQWAEELNKMDIDLMLAGHKHELYLFEAGESHIGEVTANFPVSVGSRINKKVAETFVGTAIVIGKDSIKLYHTDMDHRVLEEHTVAI